MTIKATPRDIERFTCGDCWILAQELELACGYPAYGYWSLADRLYDHHVWVRVGNKRLDIKGLRSAREFDADWLDDDEMPVRRIDWDRLEDDWDNIETYKGSRARARALAKRVRDGQA